MSKLIPFRLHPSSWMLRGNDFLIAEAKYLYRGVELEKRLAEIKFEGSALKRALIDIDWHHNIITPHMRDVLLLQVDGKEQDAVALARVNLLHQKITQYEHDQIVINATYPPGPERDRHALDLEHKNRRITAYERDIRLTEIDYPAGEERELAKLSVKHRYGEITTYQHGLSSIEIRIPEGPGRTRAILDYDHECEKIDTLNYDTKVAELEISDPHKLALALLEIRHRHNEITQSEYDKAVAVQNDEPWIGIVDSGFDPEQGLSGVYFEFDWNEQWIIYLRDNGYTGSTDSAVVDMWFADVCRAQGLAAQNAHPSSVVPFSL